ncbi:MAG TPA: tRNA-dihydrouridine synthase family protein, partial [Bellilinea sp.]|nr:tRNA-dihydrouridine synthase family protein [Bellilinea sp.]
LQRYSPDFIDINLGCSARPVTHRGAGAALLKEPLKIAKIIRETTAAIPCPLTAKIRLGWDDTSRNYLEVSKIIEEEGASLITVHGRTKVQSYSGSADWNAIAEIKASRSIPIVGNGDVLRVIDIDKMKSHTRCDAVMIGRGALANPFIFMRKDIESFTIQALVDSLMHYVKEMIEYYDEIHGIQKSRKIIKRILLNYGIELETIKHFMELENFSELEERLKSLLILA